MKPTIGRIVIYRLANSDAEAINRRRKDAQEKMPWHQALKTGAQVHVGNAVKADDEYPLIITKVWGTNETSAFNGQLLLDGNDLFWVTSTQIGGGQRKCYWPVREGAPKASGDLPSAIAAALTGLGPVPTTAG